MLRHEGRQGCWVWLGEQNRNGYGIVRYGRRICMVHRLFYVYLFDTLAEDRVLDHRCRNRLCFNPWHLEPVTVRENTLRGVGPTARNAQVTKCPAGHQYDEENTRYRPCGRRACRTCERQRSRRVNA